MNESQDLTTLIKKDKNEAFRLVTENYTERLYFHIRKILIIHQDTDDVLQNTLIKIWKNLERFKGKSAIYTWLYRIATNEALNFLNKKKRRHAEDIDNYEHFLSNSLKCDTWFTGDEIQQKLQEAILTLPQKQRIVFNMKYFDEIKYKDMAEILETSEGALKASYHHAVKKIENYLKNY